ncbi:amidohydrolase family protein [Desulforhopalus singaporensis]|uniref:Amidohydrolase family protein n=1 Tax=Desulforhopalus singaporensis TaxID=91360 RepID=A0A1H0SLH4_9BACT|nr:amidohydrolase family protein [Desulforhopalus singaporensis]SDP42088.1 Amidohydrolase family protein [Desulforhopalus singaporensis]
MSYTYDLVLQNGTINDPANHLYGRFDLAVKDGKVAEIAPTISAELARDRVDVTGLNVLPGVVDLHMHASAWLGGRFAHKMMALAGVTTALDMSGPIDSVLDIARDYGCGLNIACINYVRPGDTVADTDPSKAQLEDLLAANLKAGAIGFKILGGHYPLTPEATAAAIDVAIDNGAYLAFHAGTLETRSDIGGFMEAIDITANRNIHLAHINSYCRGRVRDCQNEAEQAISKLKENPNIVSESYLSPVNGTSGECKNGMVQSQVTVMCLEARRYETSEQGLEQAIRDGWAQVNREVGGVVILSTGQSAVDYWRARNTDTTISFAVNPEMPRLRLATARREDSSFVVDCISTDGGGIPRNVTVEKGLALVRLEAMTIDDFALKASYHPARILGLGDKGHLGIGADADITVVDLKSLRPVMTFCCGKTVMYRGRVFERGSTMITSPAGQKNVESKGLRSLVVDSQATPFCTLR